MKRKLTNETFKINLQVIIDRLKRLLVFLKALQLNIASFEKFTDDCLKRIDNLIQKNLTIPILATHLENYVKIYWLRHYIAIKDEYAVLHKGELQRSYHRKEHQSYIHQRGHEQIYFLNKYELSSCSCDGMDYEYRILSDYRPDHPKLETLATSLDAINAKFQVENDRIDACFFEIRNSLHKCPSIVSMDISCLHNNEYIKIFFSNDEAMPLKYFRADIPEDLSRAQALSPIVEDLESFAELSSLPMKAMHKKTASNLIILDSDDDNDDDIQSTNKSVNSYDNLNNDYNDVSLREIKLAHGVDEDENDMYDSDGNLVDTKQPSQATINESSSSKANVSRKKRTGLVGDGPSVNVAVDMNSMISGFLMPKNIIKTVIIKVLDPNSTAMIFYDLPIRLTWNISYLGQSSADNAMISSDEILHVVMKELWSCISPRPWIPADIVLGDQSYHHGMIFAWNRSDPLVIRCHKTPKLLSFCNSLAAILISKCGWDDDDVSQRYGKDFIFKLIPRLPSIFVQDNRAYKLCDKEIFEWNLSDLGSSLVTTHSLSTIHSAFIDAFISESILTIDPSKYIVVTLRCTMINADCLAALLMRVPVLDCTCTGIRSTDLLQATEKVSNYRHTNMDDDIIPHNKASVICTETLIISHNVLLLADDEITINMLSSSHRRPYQELLSLRHAMSNTLSGHDDDTASEEEDNPLYQHTIHSAWIDFALHAFGSRSSNIKNVDCSYIIRSDLQGYIAFYGLLRAMHQRKLLGLTALENVIIMGLIQEYPVLAQDFLTEMKLHFPTVSVDC